MRQRAPKVVSYRTRIETRLLQSVFLNVVTIKDMWTFSSRGSSGSQLTATEVQEEVLGLDEAVLGGPRGMLLFHNDN